MVNLLYKNSQLTVTAATTTHPNPSR